MSVGPLGLPLRPATSPPAKTSRAAVRNCRQSARRLGGMSGARLAARTCRTPDRWQAAAPLLYFQVPARGRLCRGSACPGRDRPDKDRGFAFERFLSDLFALYDLDPGYCWFFEAYT